VSTGRLLRAGYAVSIADREKNHEELRDDRVIGAGFGRAGTMSLKVAVEELGLVPATT
jgi:hypothetical protein